MCLGMGLNEEALRKIKSQVKVDVPWILGIMTKFELELRLFSDTNVRVTIDANERPHYSGRILLQRFFGKSAFTAKEITRVEEIMNCKLPSFFMTVSIKGDEVERQCLVKIRASRDYLEFVRRIIEFKEGDLAKEIKTYFLDLCQGKKK